MFALSYWLICLPVVTSAIKWHFIRETMLNVRSFHHTVFFWWWGSASAAVLPFEERQRGIFPWVIMKAKPRRPAEGLFFAMCLCSSASCWIRLLGGQSCFSQDLSQNCDTQASSALKSNRKWAVWSEQAGFTSFLRTSSNNISVMMLTHV